MNEGRDVPHVKCKALTICQPYAHLVCLPESERWHKRVENREWPTRYRGPLLIHAGKSRSWLADTVEGNFGFRIADMAFGAIVARCQLLACLHRNEIRVGTHDKAYPWLREHFHTNGTWCWVLGDVQPLTQPIPYRGAQGLWDFEGRP